METSAFDTSDRVDRELFDVNDLVESQMKEFTISSNGTDYKILVVKYENKFYAIGNKCTHFGLPLVNGFHYKGRVRCFAHGACFNVKTGDIEDYPGIDCLPTYRLTINEHTNKVHIHTTVKELEQKKRIPNNGLCGLSSDPLQRPHTSIPVRDPQVMQNKVASESRSKSASDIINTEIIIVGSGAAGLQCAETLREHGYGCEITFLTQELYAPYDRTKLSKSIDFQVEKLIVRDDDFYNKYQINFLKNKCVKAVDFNLKQVTCTDNKFYRYSKLVIASGLTPTKHKHSIEEINGVFSLRSYDDSNKIYKYFSKIKQENDNQNYKIGVLIIGGSFIALELAAYFNDKANVTVLSKREPFIRQFGDEIGRRIRQLHESKNVKFIIDSEKEVFEFMRDKNNNLLSVKFNNGDNLNANLCLVAIGSQPNTSFLDNKQINLTNSGYIIVDEYMRTNVKDVYACGDVTFFPSKCIQTPIDLDEYINVGHWQMASSHGKCAAFAIMEQLKPLKSIPFFWTTHFGKSIRFTGYNENYDEIIVYDDPSKKNNMKFCAFYIKSNCVIGVATCDSDPLCSTIAELMYNNVKILKQHVVNDPWGFKILVKD